MTITTKRYENLDKSLLDSFTKLIGALGESWRAGGVKAMLFRASLKTGIPVSRLRSLYYQQGIKLWASEYIVMEQAMRELALDADLANLTTLAIQNKRSLDDLEVVDTRRVAETQPFIPGLG